MFATRRRHQGLGARLPNDTSTGATSSLRHNLSQIKYFPPFIISVYSERAGKGDDKLPTNGGGEIRQSTLLEGVPRRSVICDAVRVAVTRTSTRYLFFKTEATFPVLSFFNSFSSYRLQDYGLTQIKSNILISKHRCGLVILILLKFI